MAIQTLTDLRNQVNNDIKTNGVRAITGDLMNTQLIDMIDSLESDYENQTTALDVRVSAIENLALKILQDPLTGWDASSGSFPGGGTAQLGYYWNVSVAGTVNGVEFDVGDSIVALVDNASTTTYSNNWFKEDNADRVLSVAGKIGNVTLDAADITDFDTEVANNTAVAANTLKVSNVTTNLSIGTVTGTTLDINSSDGTNATLPSFNSTDAGLVPASGGGTTNFLRADGSWVALSLDNIYTADGTIGAGRVATLTDTLTFTGGEVGIGVTPTAKFHVRGIDQNSTSSALLVENSGGTDLFDVRNNGDIFATGIDTFRTFRYDGYISTRGAALSHISSTVHTFRGTTNTPDRGVAVFTNLSESSLLSISTGGVGVMRDAALETGLAVKSLATVERGKIIDGFDSSNSSQFRVTVFGKMGLGNWGASQLTTTPVSTAAFLNVPASTVDEPNIRLETGVDVTSPLEGAIWKTANDLNFRIGGDTVKLYKETGVSAMTNVSAPVNLDADSVTVGELADIVGNLINKIQNLNLVGA